MFRALVRLTVLSAPTAHPERAFDSIGASLRSNNPILCPWRTLHPPRPKFLDMAWVSVGVTPRLHVYDNFFVRQRSELSSLHPV